MLLSPNAKCIKQNAWGTVNLSEAQCGHSGEVITLSCGKSHEPAVSEHSVHLFAR